MKTYPWTIIVPPEQTTSGAAIWGDGWMLMPLCGSESCLEDSENFCAISPSNDWTCTQCGRTHKIEGTFVRFITRGEDYLNETIAAWIGVPVEQVTITFVG